MKVPDLCAPRPEETKPVPGDKTRTPNARGLTGRNVEQRPSAGTKVEPEDPAGNADKPGSGQAPAAMDRDAQEDFASYDYASWSGESGQYESEQYELGQYESEQYDAQ